jgi:rhomboid family GlyGly-CTERM serine protease
MALAAMVIWHLPSPVTEALQYERVAVSGGEVHRLFTCHFTHFSASHLGWDLVGLVCLGTLCELRMRGRFLATLLLAGVAIPLALHLCGLNLDAYRGLSGLVSALFGLLTVRTLMRTLRDGRMVAAALIALVIVLFGMQMLTQASTGRLWLAQTGGEAFVPVPMAHLCGALCGGAGALFQSYPSLHRAYATCTADAWQGDS